VPKVTSKKEVKSDFELEMEETIQSNKKIVKIEKKIKKAQDIDKIK